jgi:hypothetical protein
MRMDIGIFSGTVCAEHCDWPLEIRKTVKKMKIGVGKKKESLEKTWN